MELLNAIYNFEKAISENQKLIDKNKQILIDIIRKLKSKKDDDDTNNFYKQKFQIVKNNILGINQTIKLMRNNMLILIKHYIITLIVLNNKIKTKIKNGKNYKDMYYEDLIDLSDGLNKNSTVDSKNILNTLELKYLPASAYRKYEIDYEKKNTARTVLDLPNAPTYTLPNMQNTGGKKTVKKTVKKGAKLPKKYR